MNRFTGKDTEEALEKSLEMKISGLIGLNAMAKHEITFNYEDNVLEVDKDHPEYLDAIGMVRKGKRLTINMEIQGSGVDVALDTGASIAYVDPVLLDGLAIVGSHQDFHPNIGFFSSNEYEIKCRVGSLEGTILASPAIGNVMNLLRNDGLRSCMSMRALEARKHVTMDFKGELLKF